MRILQFLLAASLMFLTTSETTHGSGYGKGVNISHYLSQLGPRKFADKKQFNEKDMSWIAARGYDHIRLPVDGPNIMNKDGSIRNSRLKAIDRTLEWAKKHGLNVILDIHKLPGTAFSGDIDARLFTNPEMQEQALNLWTVLANRYKSFGQELRFEIINEPVAPDPLLVNAFYEKAIRVIRDISPNRPIMLGSNRWQRFDTVEYLEPLLKYPNIIIAVHFYDPHLFTHQKAGWVGLDHPQMPDIPFPGKVPELRKYVDKDHYSLNRVGDTLTEEEVEKDFKTLAMWANEHNSDLHLGEFGVYDKVLPQYRKNWYNLVLGLCDKYDIGWAVWDYRGSFGVRDEETNEPTIVQECIDPYLTRTGD
jgi:endoglucanase